MGPFYCPLDKKVYIDLVFFEELSRRFKAPGEFAQAYVVAHEVGHHVQTLLGVSAKVREAQQRDPRRANEMQVRMELQADCLAGVWANRTNQMKQRLEPGDIESGLRRGRASATTRCSAGHGRVAPESFTHGSSAQRVRWFTNGFQSGQMQACDTFGAGRFRQRAVPDGRMRQRLVPICTLQRC
jgi:predicted metalloprotease